MKLLFEIEDENKIKWAARRLSDGKVWLLRKKNYKSASWVTVRILFVSEVEEYQRMAGTYPRA